MSEPGQAAGIKTVHFFVHEVTCKYNVAEVEKMYGAGNKKMLNMLILDLLKKYSDEEHKLSQQEILRLLKTNYGMECDRRSVKNNIMSLCEMGYDISMENGYWLVSREFEDAELRLLIDSVLCSKNMTNKQVHDLIDKLKSFGNKYFSSKVSHVSNLSEMHHADNKQLFYVLETLNDAISSGKKVSFVYNTYGIDFKLHTKRQKPYVVNPYQMVTANGFYYLIGNYDKYDDISHYRLDKISNVELLDEMIKSPKYVKEMKQGFHLPKHMAEHIYMYSGESVSVKLKADVKIMNELIDWFGKDFRIREIGERDMIIQVKCNEKAMFYWAMQYGTCVEILSPESLRNQVKDAVNAMFDKYKCTK